MSKISQNLARPSPGLMATRKNVIVPFELVSPLAHLQKLRDEAEDKAALDARISAMEAAGAIAWHVRGTRLATIGAVAGHQVASLQEELYRRFVIEKEDLFSYDSSEISSNLCRSVAIVHTAIKSIDGGEVYNPEELLALPFSDLADLWLALLGEAMGAMEGNRKAEPTEI